MRVTNFTGAVEKTGILVTKGCQVICLQNATQAMGTEKIEIALVDFTTGKETTLMRKDLAILYGEITAQGGNIRKVNDILIEVSDGRDLDLNANKVLRINLYDLDAASAYVLYSIECGIPGGLPVVYEQLIIPAGVATQRFPITDGSLLVLPKGDLKDVRVVFNDNTEMRMDSTELSIKAIATNGILSYNDDKTINQIGSSTCYIIDLQLANKKVSEIEINLIAGLGYTMYKCISMDKPGFDWKW